MRGRSNSNMSNDSGDESLNDDDTRVDRYDLLQCDGPGCNRTATFKCKHCRTSFYCRPECQEKHWLAGHSDNCVDFDVQAEWDLAKSNKDFHVATESNRVCGVCKNEFASSGFLELSNCKHVFCWDCSFAQEARQVTRDVTTSDERSYQCQQCPKDSLPYLGVHFETMKVMSKVMGSLKRLDFTPEEKKQILDCYQQMVTNLRSFKLRKKKKEIDVTASYFDGMDRIELSSFNLNATAALELGVTPPGLSLETLEPLLKPNAKNSLLLSDTLASLKLLVTSGRWDETIAKNILNLVSKSLAPSFDISPAEINTLVSACRLKLGDTAKAKASASSAVAENRALPGVHKCLAEVYECEGDLQAARTAMQKGLLYEDPWDEENKTKNVKYLARLSPQAVALRKKEAEFLLIWEKVMLVIANIPVDSEEESWASIKTLKYDIHAIDEEEVEGGAQKRKTLEKLESATTSAIAETHDIDESENSLENRNGLGVSMESLPKYKEEKDAEFDPKKFEKIKMTKDVLKWINRADGKFLELFIKRIRQLANGDRTICTAKRLVGCKKRIYEVYLEQGSGGHRILWTEQEDEVLIWYVSPHDNVSRMMGMIDKAENRRLTSASALAPFQENDEDGRHKILLDPRCDTPLKLYFVALEDISNFTSRNWRPPLYLTDQEREIVENRDGTVLLLGRSGTGKTVCIATRIDYDRHMNEADAAFSQLFVARSHRICKYVRETVGDGGLPAADSAQRLDFLTFKKLIGKCEESVGGPSPEFADGSQRVDFARFKREFPNLIEDSGLDPLVVWTQIRSSIKGSIHAVTKGRPLSLEEYLDFNVIGQRRCRLTQEQRTSAYGAFEKYDKHLRNSGLWDDCDRISSLLVRLKESESNLDEVAYRKIYVDEIQDYTQSEIALFYSLCQGGHMFFAGDPAQSVVEGVEFRFEEVRSVAFHLLPRDLHAKYIPKKPEKVTVNFRSHSGILNVAAAVLDRLFVGFKDSAPDLKSKDLGLFNGPRPGLFDSVGRQGLLELVAKIEGVVLLAMHDKEVEELSKIVPKGVVVLSIRDSKGLEFPDVILVDFFKTLPQQHQKPWRTLLGSKGEELAGFQEQYPEIETHLKQLYTAITRCSIRFFVAETKSSTAGQSFVKWVTNSDLAVKQNVVALKDIVKTADEWRSTGIDYAVNAEGSEDPERAEFWLNKALVCFERGEAQDLEAKVDIHVSSIKFRMELDSGVDVQDQDDTEKLLKRAADILADLIESGLRLEAAKLCDKLQAYLDDYGRSRFQEGVLPFLPELD